MDEYMLEINELRRRLAKLKLERAPQLVIEELEAQLRILKAIYDASWRLFLEGEEDEALHARFRDRDLGEWTFENVYFYVYDEVSQLEAEGGDFAERISGHDYLASLADRVPRDAAAQA
jgi:hypothetical protein